MVVMKVVASLILVLASSFLVVSPAAASRSDDLVLLSTVFGELHFVRRLCEPVREQDYWRERMKQLVALEKPTARERRRLVEGFNKGYNNAQGQFSACTAQAELFSINRAERGEAIVLRLGGIPSR